MLRRRLSWGIGLLGVGASAVAAGAGAAVATALAAGNQYLDQWQNLTPEEVAEGKFCELATGWRIHYIEKGRENAEGSESTKERENAQERTSQTPVVFIHGFMDSVRSWQQNVDALASKRRVLALDMPGFGSSTRVRQPVYSLKRMSKVLNEFLEQQGIVRANLIGHSMGGALAAQFTYDFPEKVDQLILESAAIYFPIPKSLAAPDWIPPVIARGALGLAMMSARAVEVSLRSVYGSPNRVADEAIRLRERALRVQGTTEALVAMFGSPRESDLPGAVSKIEQPTLLIWGARDHLVPLADARRLRRELPNARLAIYYQAGHLPHEEFPNQVNELMNQFLDKGFEGMTETGENGRATSIEAGPTMSG